MINCAKALSSNQMPWLILMAGILFIASPLMAQSVQHLGTTQAGGMPGLPVMGGVELLTNGVQVTWDGPSGYYQVYQKSNSLSAPWVALGKATNLVRYAVITRLYTNAFFRVSGPAPNYAGSKVCLTCHSSICQYETNTLHASAFSNAAFKAAGGQTNSSCLPCHTVGYGLPTGFSFTNKNGIFSYTTNLAGVQCENCHGPAANHAASEDDPTVVPQIDIAATVCGGCHTGPMQPTYEEWNTSGHAAVVPDALKVMSSSTNISSCGQCHSGSVRLALVNGQNPITLTNDLKVAITCVVCHDPHQTNGNPAQLRNPLSSTNFFSLATTAVFTNVYPANTNVNLCGQCHNSRGAAWTDTAYAPHRSLQYNFLLGSVGQLWNGVTDSPALFNPGTHAGLPESAQNSISGTFYLTNQCVSCHMQPDAPPATTQSHTFAVASDAVCLNCHLDDPGQSGPGISNEVTTVIVLLNDWAATQGAALQASGVVAWEYTTPGGLILQTNSLGYATGWTQLDYVNYSGPSAANQALIPDNIKKARFDLYLVVNDGSLGAHNWIFALNLLTTAENLIYQEIDQ
ncbi:MAG TPA: cytochrome c family protein [Candidatus Nitrosopolaris sp.]|nr:cytochrome c family protein [Candidatus Nitrosopolaris sp.]